MRYAVSIKLRLETDTDGHKAMAYTIDLLKYFKRSMAYTDTVLYHNGWTDPDGAQTYPARC